ncbi:putative phage protein [Selenomonas ruminantium subsp. lactilytica TAM6421]|uniref:Putative phage protein n=1 Tax=Selenomonas ruminantium subsp. lactilytica (strain NBRC 103574 / TAM6421) TaxID=927704 RepID=I0GS19_SELRL|nr:AAA family ATPase [Selenomonas ruminantium]BAL83556.1 putative phage protein [Selenomonas ruminantium subsp. lactilytica TAM6421]
MANSILIIGESGAGKTTSIRTLDPKTTFIIDCDRKGLSFRGWKKMYNTANKNYIATSNLETIWGYLKRISYQDMTHIKTVIIDTLNGIMVDDEFRRMHEKSFDKWQDLAASVYGLVTDIHELRDDLTIVCTAHAQTDRDDNGYMFTHMKTSGRKLDKIVVESKFTTVLLAKADNGKYVFETHANHSTAKSPMDCFAESEIPNDLKYVIETLDKYENE